MRLFTSFPLGPWALGNIDAGLNCISYSKMIKLITCSDKIKIIFNCPLVFNSFSIVEFSKSVSLSCYLCWLLVLIERCILVTSVDPCQADIITAPLIGRSLQHPSIGFYFLSSPIRRSPSLPFWMKPIFRRTSDEEQFVKELFWFLIFRHNLVSLIFVFF